MHGRTRHQCHDAKKKKVATRNNKETIDSSETSTRYLPLEQFAARWRSIATSLIRHSSDAIKANANVARFAIATGNRKADSANGAASG